MLIKARSPKAAAERFREVYDWSVAEWPDERVVLVREEGSGLDLDFIVICVTMPSYTAERIGEGKP
jgi:hypothetical protein